ncbi:MAG TPA: hypothetical protein IAB35_03820, partial [Candidatus Faecimonas gallistercoris]|nr:hypothetical protein [Candidatus Faecimonas gallistercoris]
LDENPSKIVTACEKLTPENFNKLFSTSKAVEYINNLSDNKFINVIEEFPSDRLTKWIESKTFTDRLTNMSVDEFYKLASQKDIVDICVLKIAAESENSQNCYNTLNDILNKYYNKDILMRKEILSNQKNIEIGSIEKPFAFSDESNRIIEDITSRFKSVKESVEQELSNIINNSSEISVDYSNGTYSIPDINFKTHSYVIEINGIDTIINNKEEKDTLLTELINNHQGDILNGDFKISEITNSKAINKIVERISQITNKDINSSIEILLDLAKRKDINDQITVATRYSDDLKNLLSSINGFNLNKIIDSINDTYLKTSKHPNTVYYSESEIKKILNSDELINNIENEIQSTSRLEFTEDLADFRKILDIADLVKQNKVSLTNTEQLNINKILKYQDKYENLMKDAIKEQIKFLSDYNSVTDEIYGIKIADVKEFMTDLSELSTGKVYNDIITSSVLLNHLKLSSKLMDIVNYFNLGLSKQTLNNLKLLSNEYLNKLSQQPSISLNFDNTYGARQNILATIFKDTEEIADINVREKLEKAITGIVGINQDVKDNIYNIVREYFPTMKKTELKKYLASINVNAGVCSYANVVNGIYIQFADKEQLFKEIFGYDMYCIENGKKIMNDQYLLADLYSYANQNNSSLIDITPDGNTTYLEEGEQIFLSSRKEGVDKNIIEAFLNHKISEANLDLKAKVDGEVKFFGNSDNKTGYKDLTEMKRTITAGIEKGNMVSMGVFHDSARSEFLTMYRYNPKTNELKAPYVPQNKTFSHSMQVTGVKDDGVIVSSWGEKYYIPFSELDTSDVTISTNKIILNDTK